MVPVTFGVTTGGVVSTRNIPSATIVKTAPAPGENPFETVTVNVPLAVEADPDVGIGLVVPQPDVEARPVPLDELLLGEQRLGLCLRDQEVDRRDRTGEAARMRASGEVGGDPFPDRARLADVDHVAVPVPEQVDARLVGQLSALVVKTLPWRLRHGTKVRLRPSRHEKQEMP